MLMNKNRKKIKTKKSVTTVMINRNIELVKKRQGSGEKRRERRALIRN